MSLSVEQKEVSLPIGIIVEKRKSLHPWANWNWKPVAVFVDLEFAEIEPVKLISGDDFEQFHAGTLLLNLHRKETEALRLNLMLPEPELYVVLREDEEGSSEFPFSPYLVTASSYDVQDLADTGDDIIEKVAMPEPVAAFIQAFVEEHHVDEEFKKRRRDKLNVEEQKFGKTPIFQTHTKQ
ncbi:MAG: DUF3305 domain-containing protein [Rhizobiaceae bacterium]